MQSSCRNRFSGTVSAVHRGAVNSEVVLEIGGDDQLIAIITNNSVDDLALQPGKQAYALIKAPWVILTRDDQQFKTSARNSLRGKVVSCQEGAINAEVIVELPGGQLVTAIITDDSIEALGIAVGETVCALIKASHIILAVAR
ncbi:MAG: TOBE domain-containing protein [Methylovulum sp.]|nr:TOBE domain-containing protein [Methylovulum sp.]